MRFVDLLLYSETEITDFESLYSRHRSTLGYLKHLPHDFEVTAIQHAGFSANIVRNKIEFKIKRSGNHKWRIPFSLFLSLRKQGPEVILVHSMIYSWQIIFLGLIKHKKSRVLVQNHAERPGLGFRRVIEKIAARCIDGFLFVSKVQADPWQKAGIISHEKPVFEIMEGSTYFSERESARTMSGSEFLWVGRLDKNKDPLTILKAFYEFSKENTQASLKMIYNAGRLKHEVEEFIQINDLRERVSLLRDVPHEHMQKAYSEADYFLLGSHYEGSGFALCEAMACGCVPIVTNIPSFSMMVKNGTEGFLFSPGNHQELLTILRRLDPLSYPQIRKNVLEKFKTEHSFEAIARKMAEIARAVTSQNAP